MSQQIVNFISLGSMYAVVAIGFSLYFGTANLINFAHGDLCTLAAFLLLLFVSLLHSMFPDAGLLTFMAAVILSMIACSAIGVISERILFRPIRNRPILEGLIISLAFSMVIRESILHFYPNGGNPQAFWTPFQLGHLHVLGANIAYVQVALVAICIALAALFFWIVKFTRFGLSMRATAQDPEAATMIGIRVDRTIAIAFAVGAAFAAVAGILSGAVYGSVKFDMGFGLGIKGFAAAVIGGLDSPNGAFLGGMLLAAMEVAIVALVPGGSAYRDSVAFVLLIVVLLLRPSGMLSTKREFSIR